MREYRLLVIASSGFDDAMSLRTSLDKVFDSLASDVELVVVHPGVAIAGSWAQEAARQGLSVREETFGDDWGALVDGCLAAIRPGEQTTDAKVLLMRAARQGVPIEIVVQGHGMGLPEDLIGRQGQGRPKG
jgi:hypothetical protein